MAAQIFTKAGAPLYTSEQAAARLGMRRNALMVMLHRYKQLRPALKLSIEYLWTECEMEAVALQKATAKRGRPAKQ